ncbi:MAG: LuxR C-terminal-related transcriptional regulator [Nitratireductor sp.]
MLDIATNTAVFPATYGARAIVKPLVETYAAYMPFYAITMQMELDVPVPLQGLFDMAGPNGRQQFMDSPIARDWMQVHGITDALGVLVEKRAEKTGLLVINRKSERGPFSTGEQTRLAFLAPHIRRAVVISDLFKSQVRSANMFGEMLDAMATPVMVVKQDMSLAYANPSAEEMFRLGNMARILAGKVVFKAERASSIIHHAIETGDRQEIALGTLGLGVPLTLHRSISVAHVLPLRSRQLAAEIHSQASAAIFIAGQDYSSDGIVEVFSALYGLTVAERRVVQFANKGMTRAQIAESIGVADSTVKSQLNSIYNKTGVTSLRDLAQLLVSMMPPFRSNE